jgi:hypothetical protein
MLNEQPNPDFAELVVEALIQAKVAAAARGEPGLYRKQMIALIRKLDTEDLCRTLPNGKANPRRRNALLDALVTLNGEDLAQVPAAVFRQAVGALRDIREVCPEVTAEEIKRRASNLRKQMNISGPLSSSALAKWWATADRSSMTGAEEVKVRT